MGKGEDKAKMADFVLRSISKRDFTSLLSVFSNSAMPHIVAEPEQGKTIFKAINNSKTAYISIVINRDFARERAFLDVGKIKKGIKGINSPDVALDISSKHTVLYTSTQEITLANINPDLIPIFPKINVPPIVRVVLDYPDFMAFIKHTLTITNVFKITADTLEVQFESVDDDGNTVNLYLPADMLRELKCEKRTVSSYNAIMVKNFVSSLDAEYVGLSFSHNGLLKVDVRTDLYDAYFYLAPVVGNDA